LILRSWIEFIRKIAVFDLKLNALRKFTFLAAGNYYL
jgi:hypothetical protein